MKKSGVLTLLLALLLTGCSLLPLSAEEQSYKDNCQIVYDNYQDYKALQNKFYNAKYDEPDYEWQTWPTGYAITNAGNSSRAVVDAAIKKQFPWLKTLVDSYLQGLSRKDFMKEESADLRDGTLEYLAIEAFFTQMSEGSSFTLTKKILKLTPSLTGGVFCFILFSYILVCSIHIYQILDRRLNIPIQN